MNWLWTNSKVLTRCYLHRLKPTLGKSLWRALVSRARPEAVPLLLILSGKFNIRENRTAPFCSCANGRWHNLGLQPKAATVRARARRDQGQMPPHVRRGGTRGRSNTPRHAAQARAGLSASRSAPRTPGKFAAFDEFCKRLLGFTEKYFFEDNDIYLERSFKSQGDRAYAGRVYWTEILAQDI